MADQCEWGLSNTRDSHLLFGSGCTEGWDGCWFLAKGLEAPGKHTPTGWCLPPFPEETLQRKEVALICA